MHTAESILGLLDRSDAAVKRAIKALAVKGFDGPDAAFLADIFRKLPLYDDRMTPPQYRRARKALRGYVDRLVEIANASMGEVAQPAPAESPAPRETELPPAVEWGIF